MRLVKSPTVQKIRDYFAKWKEVCRPDQKRWVQRTERAAMRRQEYTLTCEQCGCQFGDPSPEPTEMLCDICTEIKEWKDDIDYIVSCLESARYSATMHNRRDMMKRMKEAQDAAKEFVRVYK